MEYYVAIKMIIITCWSNTANDYNIMLKDTAEYEIASIL
jgi:hypothetical protein